MRKALEGDVALVAGASRGCGRGVALALGEAGATVYVTGRTTLGGPTPVDGAAGTIEDTALEVTHRGGRGIPLPVDHTDATQIDALLARIWAEHARLDICVCAVWGGNERFLDPSWKQPFWQQPVEVWREFLDAGARAFFLTARAAAKRMAMQRSGLIVTITEPVIERTFEGQFPPLAETFGNIAHYTLNRLVQSFGADAAAVGVTLLGLLPGFMKTERVEMHLAALGNEARKQFRYDLAESPEYAGRAVVALATDPKALEKAGNCSMSPTWRSNMDLPMLTADASATSIARLDFCPER